VNGAKKAVYPLPVAAKGKFRLYGRVPYRWNIVSGSSTAIIVKSAEKEIPLKWNQTLRMGEWIDLGEFELTPGATLTVDPAASTGTVIADGFAIMPAE
jgi:hypothetical protein